MFCSHDSFYSGSSGSRRALRLAVVAEGEVVERTKLQRIEAAWRESCRITIWAVRRGPAVSCGKTQVFPCPLAASRPTVPSTPLGQPRPTPPRALRPPPPPPPRQGHTPTAT